MKTSTIIKATLKKLFILFIISSFLYACSRPPAQPWQPSKPKKHKTKH